MTPDRTIERWYDRATRSWVCQLLDDDGNQLGSAIYVHGKADALAVTEASFWDAPEVEGRAPDERRPACILINAGTGDHWAARGLVGRALRQELRVRRWGIGPHWVAYTPGRADVTARFTLSCTADEFARVQHAIAELASDEGWSQPPVDCYRD